MLLVTGGAGYIGSHTVRALDEMGRDLVVYDDLSEGHREAVVSNKLVVGDVLDTDLLADTLAAHGVTGVLHFAARCYVGESMENPDLYWRVNRDGTQSLLEAMARTGVEHLIFSSTCAVYGVPSHLPIAEEAARRPINVYGETKVAMEDDITAAAGVRSVVLRYFNAAGASPDGLLAERHDPETHLIPLALLAARDGATLTIHGGDYPTPDGTCLRDYVHVCDLASAHVAAVDYLESGGASLIANLGYGHGYSIREVVEAVSRVTGVVVKTEVGPNRPGDPPSLYADGQKARGVLGWTPQFQSLDDIVEHAWRTLQN